MKNLTGKQITIERADGTRVSLPPLPNPPQVVVEPEKLIGFLGVMEFFREPVRRVDFGDLALSEEDQPFIVTKEVFDALPPDMVEFVTPHPDHTVSSSFNNWDVVKRFHAKANAYGPNYTPEQDQEAA